MEQPRLLTRLSFIKPTGTAILLENAADMNDSVFTGLIQQQTLPLGAADRKAASRRRKNSKQIKGGSGTAEAIRLCRTSFPELSIGTSCNSFHALPDFRLNRDSAVSPLAKCSEF